MSFPNKKEIERVLKKLEKVEGALPTLPTTKRVEPFELPTVK